MTYFVERVVPDFLPMERAYGIYVSYNALSREQQRIGNRVEIHYRTYGALSGEGSGRDVIDGLLCYSHSVTRPTSLRFAARVAKELGASDSDVIHSHTRFALPLVLMGLKKPHVVHLHGLPYYATEQGLGHKRYDYEAYLHMQFLLRKADMVVCYCDSLARRVAQIFRLDPSRIRVVYNGVDTRLMSRPGFDLRTRFSLDDRPIAVFAGRAEPIKGPVEFVKACRLARQRMPELVPVVIGSGWDAFLRRVGSCDEFVEIPHVAHIDMGGVYRSCDVHVALTKVYGHQKTVLEAAACGVPVVATDNRDNRAVCDHCAIYVDPSDTDDVARGIVRSINEGPTRRDLSRNSRIAAATYSWRRSAETIQKIYNHLLA